MLDADFVSWVAVVTASVPPKGIALPFLLEALVTALIGVVLAAGALGAFWYFAMHERASDHLKFMPWVGFDSYVSSLVWIAILGPLLTLVPTLILTRKYIRV